MRTTITLQTEQPTKTNEVDHSNKCMTSWNVNDNRQRYTNHVDRLSMNTTHDRSISHSTDVIMSRETAQLQTDTTCQQIVKCIHMISDCVKQK